MALSFFRRSQRGATTAEFALAAIPLLLAGTAIGESGHWLLTRQLVRLALHEAARAAATQHAHPDIVRTAFEAALSPLYVPAGPHASPHARMRASHAAIQRSSGLEPWRIEVLGPPPAAYRDFAQAGHQYGGRSAISNDYLAEQHTRALQRWRHGMGPASGLDIYQANTLHLKLHYLRPPLTPLLGSVLRAVSPLAPSQSRPALASGLLTMTLEVRMMMQSDPVAWELPDQTITGGYGGVRGEAGLPSWPDQTAPGTVNGTPQPDQPAPKPGNDTPPPSEPNIPIAPNPDQPGDAAPSQPSPIDPSTPEQEDPLCGVVLCCSG